jgi:hypothetical protein
VNPKNRLPTIVLALGAIVLLAAIAVGQRMGDRVLGDATEHTLDSVAPVAVTPAPDQTTGAYGPNWKRSQTLAGAPDPHFPDPRIPPEPLPTRPPVTPSPTPPPATPTPNPDIPIWRQEATPSAAPSETPSAEPSATAVPTETPSAPP